MPLRFQKMHGLGNDFVVLDARDVEVSLDPAAVRRIGDRHRGVGFDQLIVIRDDSDHAAALEFWNPDGSTASACGNGTRCAAQVVMNGSGTSAALKTAFGTLPVERLPSGLFRVNMGQPQLDWDKVPLAKDMPLDPLPIGGAPAAVGMGNPHCVFVVDDAEAVDVAARGAEIEHHPLFPERTNVEFIQVLSRSEIRMRVWERGGMITQACGSGACASVVATALRDLTERNVTVHLDGGALEIDWRDDGVWMTGPATHVFDGELSDAFLAGP